MIEKNLNRLEYCRHNNMQYAICNMQFDGKKYKVL